MRTGGRLKTTTKPSATAREFAKYSIGKTCIVVNRDVAGFVTTVSISALVVEAANYRVRRGHRRGHRPGLQKLGFGHASWARSTADLTGVDILLHATGNVTETQDERSSLRRS